MDQPVYAFGSDHPPEVSNYLWGKAGRLSTLREKTP